MRRLLVALALLALIAAHPAFAGHSNPPLSLTSEQSGKNPNTPPWCMGEDDYDYRTFTGSLAGSYSTTYQLCNSSVDYYNGVYWNAGGEGIQASLDVSGTYTDLSITAPDGSSHHGVLVSTTVFHGVTTQHYQVCYVPPYFVSTDTGTSPLAGGVYTMSVSGQFTSTAWTTRADMTDVTFQRTYCPPSEQNLIQ